jgi:O-antigen ligase
MASKAKWFKPVLNPALSAVSESALDSPIRAFGRLTTVALAGLLAVLACSGAMTSLAFNVSSAGKWAVCVAATVATLVVLVTRRPVTYLAAAAVLIVPFSSLTFTVSAGTSVQVARPIILIAAVVALLSSDRRTGDELQPSSAVASSWLPGAALIAVLSLLPAGASGVSPGALAVQAGLLAALVYAIARACALDRHAPVIIAATMSVSAAIQGLLAIVEFKSGHPLNLYGGPATAYGHSYFFGYQGEFRPGGAFSDPISLGNALALTLPMAFAGATATKNFYIRLIFAASGLLAAAGLVVTFSRMSWIGAALGVVVVVVLSPASRWFGQLAALVVTGVALSASAIAIAGPQLIERFNSLLHPTARGVVTAHGDVTRQRLWSAALSVFENHPLFGVGSGRLNPLLLSAVGGTQFTHAHSTYFEYLAESGMLGGLALLVIVVAGLHDAAVRMRLSHRTDWLATGCAGAVVAILICWLTDYTIRYTPVLLSMALPLALLFATRREATPAEGHADRAPRAREGFAWVRG